MSGRTAQTYNGVTFSPGAKFKVIRDGAFLTGWRPDGPSAWVGERLVLHVGDVIECAGFGAGFGSDPGYGIEWEDPRGEIGLMEFVPMGGHAFSYRPAEGFLEPVEEVVDGEEARADAAHEQGSA